MKKASDYCLVIITFLVLLQSAQDVPECGVYTYNQFTSTETIERCIEVEEIFEGALLKAKVNSHILRNTFLSSSHPSPQLLNVIYSIMNASHTTSNIEAVWSSSQVFTIIDPMILHDLQSGIMTLVYYTEGILFPETIVIYLNLSNRQLEGFTQKEYIHGIISITEKVSTLVLLIS